jgi:hypothetical protein
MAAASPEAGDRGVASLVDGERDVEEAQAHDDGRQGKQGHDQPEAAAFTRTRIALIVGGYAAGLAAMVGLKGLYLTPDRYFLILLVPALLLGIARRYALDFLPFIVLMIVYEELRGVANLISPHPYYAPQLDIDRWLFGGTVPTLWLQHELWHGSLTWWNATLSLLIRLHFIVPPTLVFLTWLRNRALAYRFAATILAVSFLAVIGFAMWPAAPPWMASAHHWIGPLVRIDNLPIGGHRTSAAAVQSSDHSWISQQLLRNDAAAMPSLHAAYALLVTLFALTLSRRWGLIALPYTAGMWFAIVYFGEHYVSDAIVGSALAAAVFFALRWVWPRTPLAGPFPPPLAGARGSPGPHQVV